MGQIKTNNIQFETHILADHRGKLLAVGPDSGTVDAFGRARVSEPFTLFDSTMRFDARPDQWFTVTSGSASTTYIPNQSSLLLSVAASGDSVLRRTKKRFPYQPGKSLQFLQSFVGTVPASGLVQEVGLFDDDNGVMMRINGEDVQFVIRGKYDGAVEETVINQADWNIDTYDELDVSKANIFTADIEWLGSGRVRLGFIVDGEYKYCHEQNHANAIDHVYMTTAILPCSYRIASTGPAGAVKQICTSVQSEGGYEPAGPIYIIGRGASGVAAISSEQVVAGIRMASGRTGNVIMPSQVDATIEGNTTALWRLRLNPTITSGTWAAADNGRGNVQTLTAATFSGGTVVAAGLVGSRGSTAFNAESALSLALGVDGNGASDVLVLTMEADSSTKGLGVLGWRELV
ncbi:MAG: hypothetical protein ACO3HP_04615 [Candidatus Nanopelagicaceae bacterium]